ncbi:crossover junction endodeoxyribonuclease RuvC [Natronogracilivirga saccharolytica]|uniref:Crossover junction endodeoxyribonuclease RuvC n=1 Tax=Natronogracilivirga saccharolytica TaxID=2812953 RepID=A0A8J7USI5_9BACT|nr:crossover junction endodeoxyribonuclease RuvC [Natronogracilivirga saccharolytica]MBP3191556.1 crossover junction endodeoxyribonuclease RuvC [Natronogracilivirga saccharolytica]
MITRILGVDPGSRSTGYAVLEKKGQVYRSVCCDTIRLSGTPDPHERLKVLYADITHVIRTYEAEICAIETPVYGKDPAAMLKLGRAQAALIMGVLHCGIPLFEYYPKAVKKAITGTGNATKGQVAYMLHKMISIPDEALSDDATDALAVAWCHFQKLRDPQGVTESADTSTGFRHRRKNSWDDFVENNPDRVRNP